MFASKEEPPLDVPCSTEDVVSKLQDVMMTAVEKGTPRMDIDLPPGLRIGVDVDEEMTPLEPPPAEGLSAKRVALADRDLAAAFVLQFEGLQNSVNLCVLFRTEKLAVAAKRAWGDYGKARVTSFPNPKLMDSSALALGRVIGNRPFIVAVAPRERQLRDLQAICAMEDAKFCLILVNARLRGLAEPTDLKDEMATKFEPAFHLSLLGPRGEGILYRSLGEPWVLVRRRQGDGDGGADEKPKELLRSDTEPLPGAVQRALDAALARAG